MSELHILTQSNVGDSQACYAKTYGIKYKFSIKTMIFFSLVLSRPCMCSIMRRSHEYLDQALGSWVDFLVLSDNISIFTLFVNLWSISTTMYNVVCSDSCGCNFTNIQIYVYTAKQMIPVNFSWFDVFLHVLLLDCGKD